MVGFDFLYELLGHDTHEADAISKKSHALEKALYLKIPVPHLMPMDLYVFMPELKPYGNEPVHVEENG